MQASIVRYDRLVLLLIDLLYLSLPLSLVKLKDILFVNDSEYYQVGRKKGHGRIAITLPSRDHTSLQLLVASNTVRHPM